MNQDSFKDVLNGLFAVFAGMILFKATTYIGFVENAISSYPVYFAIGGLLLFFFRTKITDALLRRNYGRSN